MAHVITFTTRKFDVSSETPNPINPIAGQSVLQWLREPLAAARYDSTDPAPEDWGWYMEIRGAGGSYLVGASGEASDSNAAVDWTIQVHKHRSLSEKITGRNKLAADDPLVAVLASIVRGGAAISGIEIDTSG